MLSGANRTAMARTTNNRGRKMMSLGFEPRSSLSSASYDVLKSDSEMGYRVQFLLSSRIKNNQKGSFRAAHDIAFSHVLKIVVNERVCELRRWKLLQSGLNERSCGQRDGDRSWLWHRLRLGRRSLECTGTWLDRRSWW